MLLGAERWILFRIRHSRRMFLGHVSIGNAQHLKSEKGGAYHLKTEGLFPVISIWEAKYVCSGLGAT